MQKRVLVLSTVVLDFIVLYVFLEGVSYIYAVRCYHLWCKRVGNVVCVGPHRLMYSCIYLQWRYDGTWILEETGYWIHRLLRHSGLLFIWQSQELFMCMHAFVSESQHRLCRFHGLHGAPDEAYDLSWAKPTICTTKARHSRSSIRHFLPGLGSILRSATHPWLSSLTFQ